MKKLVYIILGLIFIPLIIAFIFIAIPLFLLFLLFLRMFTGGRSRTSSRSSPPPRQRTAVPPSDDIYDVECEVVDDEKKK